MVLICECPLQDASCLLARVYWLHSCYTYRVGVHADGHAVGYINVALWQPIYIVNYKQGTHMRWWSWSPARLTFHISTHQASPPGWSDSTANCGLWNTRALH